MAAPDALTYSRRELRSYLPTGWNLVVDDAASASDPGAWDDAERIWRTRIADGAEQPWELAVSAAEAERHGRLEALCRAFDRVYREALG